MKRALIAGCCLLLFCAVSQAQGTAEVGKPAPDFSVTGIDGKDLKLSEVTASGKNVVLIFDRASW